MRGTIPTWKAIRRTYIRRNADQIDNENVCFDLGNCRKFQLIEKSDLHSGNDQPGLLHFTTDFTNSSKVL